MEKILTLTLMISLASTARANDLSTLSSLAVDVTNATEKIEEVIIKPNDFQLTAEKTQYWINNAEVRQTVDTIGTKIEDGDCDKTAPDLKKENAGGQSQVKLLVRYSSPADFSKENDFLRELGKSRTAKEMMDAIIWAKDATERQHVINHAKNVLSFEEKVRLGSYLGNAFGSNYDFDRAGDGPRSGGVVTLEELVRGYKARQRSGVCRDIAQAQVEVLNKMGVDCKVTAYSTQSGEGHATVACTDRKNPDRVIKLNYGELTSDNGKGVASLRQNTSIPDLSLSYDIYDSSGKILVSQSSELGKMMAEVTNLKATKLDPQERYKGTLVKGEIGDHGSIFYGETITGEQVAGLAGYVSSTSELKLANGTNLGKISADFALGIAGAKKVTTVMETDTLIVYGRSNVEYETPDLLSFEKIDSTLFAGYNGEMGVTKVMKRDDGGKSDGFFSRPKHSIDIGTRNTFTINDSTLGLEVAERFTIGSKDVRDGDSSLTIAPTHTVIRSTFEKPVTDELAIITSSSVVYRNQLGSTLQTEILEYVAVALKPK